MFINIYNIIVFCQIYVNKYRNLPNRFDRFLIPDYLVISTLQITEIQSQVGITHNTQLETREQLLKARENHIESQQ